MVAAAKRKQERYEGLKEHCPDLCACFLSRPSLALEGLERAFLVRNMAFPRDVTTVLDEFDDEEAQDDVLEPVGFPWVSHFASFLLCSCLSVNRTV